MAFDDVPSPSTSDTVVSFGTCRNSGGVQSAIQSVVARNTSASSRKMLRTTAQK